MFNRSGDFSLLAALRTWIAAAPGICVGVILLASCGGGSGSGTATVPTSTTASSVPELPIANQATRSGAPINLSSVQGLNLDVDSVAFVPTGTASAKSTPSVVMLNAVTQPKPIPLPKDPISSSSILLPAVISPTDGDLTLTRNGTIAFSSRITIQPVPISSPRGNLFKAALQGAIASTRDAVSINIDRPQTGGERWSAALAALEDVLALFNQLQAEGSLDLGMGVSGPLVVDATALDYLDQVVMAGLVRQDPPLLTSKAAKPIKTSFIDFLIPSAHAQSSFDANARCRLPGLSGEDEAFCMYSIGSANDERTFNRFAGSAMAAIVVIGAIGGVGEVLAISGAAEIATWFATSISVGVGSTAALSILHNRLVYQGGEGATCESQTGELISAIVGLAVLPKISSGLQKFLSTVQKVLGPTPSGRTGTFINFLNWLPVAALDELVQKLLEKIPADLCADAPIPKSLKLFPKGLALALGQSFNVTVQLLDKDGRSLTLPNDLQWSTNDASIAGVVDGTVHGNSLGNAVVAASSPSTKLPPAQTSVTVTGPDNCTYGGCVNGRFPTPDNPQNLMFMRSAVTLLGAVAIGPRTWATPPPSLDGYQAQEIELTDSKGLTYRSIREYWYCIPGHQSCIDWATGATNPNY